MSPLLDPEDLGPPAPAADVAALAAWADFDLPADYRGFLLASDGYNGPVGRGYLDLWACGRALALNEGYEVRAALPGHLLIGSNAGPTAYAIGGVGGGPRFISVPFVPMTLAEARPLGSTFAAFLQAIGAGQGF